MFQYLLIPIVLGLVWLILRIKPLKALSVKKKRAFSIIIALVLWTTFGAVPYMFSYNTPETAIKYTIENWKSISVVGTLNNGTEGAYVMYENHGVLSSYYLKKVGDKWRMPSRIPKNDTQAAIYDSSFIHYRHYIKEGFVVIEYDSFVDNTASPYQVADNKGTVFYSVLRKSYQPDKTNVLYYGMYLYDNAPYELYVNGELAYTYSKN